MFWQSALDLTLTGHGDSPFLALSGRPSYASTSFQEPFARRTQHSVISHPGDSTTVTPGIVDPARQGCNPPMSAVKSYQHVSLLGWSLGHFLLETEFTGQLFALGFPVVSYDNCTGHFWEAGWVSPPPASQAGFGQLGAGKWQACSLNELCGGLSPSP